MYTPVFLTMGKKSILALSWKLKGKGELYKRACSRVLAKGPPFTQP